MLEGIGSVEKIIILRWIWGTMGKHRKGILKTVVFDLGKNNFVL